MTVRRNRPELGSQREEDGVRSGKGASTSEESSAPRTRLRGEQGGGVSVSGVTPLFPGTGRQALLECKDALWGRRSSPGGQKREEPGGAAPHFFATPRHTAIPLALDGAGLQAVRSAASTLSPGTVSGYPRTRGVFPARKKLCKSHLLEKGPPRFLTTEERGGCPWLGGSPSAPRQPRPWIFDTGPLRQPRLLQGGKSRRTLPHAVVLEFTHEAGCAEASAGQRPRGAYPYRAERTGVGRDRGNRVATSAGDEITGAARR